MNRYRCVVSDDLRNVVITSDFRVPGVRVALAGGVFNSKGGCGSCLSTFSVARAPFSYSGNSVPAVDRIGGGCEVSPSIIRLGGRRLFGTFPGFWSIGAGIVL